MKTFVIGDVHGRREQLHRLVGMLPRDPDQDTLVLLGDLVDRGEDVPGTVEEAMRLRGSRRGAGRYLARQPRADAARLRGQR